MDKRKIKGYRTMAGMSQEQMAEALNISIRAYQNKENCLCDFTATEIKAFIEALASKHVLIKFEDLN